MKTESRKPYIRGKSEDRLPPLPEPPRKTYQPGQQIRIQRKGEEGEIRIADCQIIQVYEHYILTHLKISKAEYKECFYCRELIRLEQDQAAGGGNERRRVNTIS